jgi:hypothetical protein
MSDISRILRSHAGDDPRNGECESEVMSLARMTLMPGYNDGLGAFMGSHISKSRRCSAH